MDPYRTKKLMLLESDEDVDWIIFYSSPHLGDLILFSRQRRNRR